MVRPLRFGFVPTRNRAILYAELVECVTPQLDTLITLAHGPEALSYAVGDVIAYDADTPDLSAMWNAGIDRAAELANGLPYYVAIFNDDALVASDWYDRMIAAIEADGSAGASAPRAPGKAASIMGGAFVITPGIRLTGVFRWYFTDDEVQKLCERAGGFSIVEGVHAVNRCADQNFKASPELQRVSAEDGPKFLAMYGAPASPWGNTEWPVVVEGDPARVGDDRRQRLAVSGTVAEQLAAGAAHFRAFVYVPQSVAPKPGFWEALDSEQGSAWLFPTGYAGIYDSAAVQNLLPELPDPETVRHHLGGGVIWDGPNELVEVSCA